jgi:hypothetical protein
LFTLYSRFLKSFGKRSLVIGQCVRFGSDGTGNVVGVWALKDLLVKDRPPIPRPPHFGERVTHFSKDGRTVLGTKDMRELHGDPVGE